MQGKPCTAPLAKRDDQVLRDNARTRCRVDPSPTPKRIIEFHDTPQCRREFRLPDHGAAAYGKRRGVRRRTLVTVGVHSGQRSRSWMVAQTSSADALISVSIWKNVINAPLRHQYAPRT